MKTISEIVARCQKPESMFGWDVEVLLEFIPFEHARPFLKPDATAEGWDAVVKPLTREAVIAAMASYMEFAWGKAIDHRGLSAGRSIEKLCAHLWLLGEDNFAREVEAAPYAQYGCPQLKLICERFSFPIPDDEDARRMMNGERCTATYDCGCGQ